MATLELYRTPDGILTAKEDWAVGKDEASVREQWLNEISRPRKEEREKKDVQEYIRKLKALTEEREEREAELEAAREHARQVREHARQLGAFTVLFQQQAEEQERERAKAEEAAAQLEQKFRRLANQWREETFLSSSITDNLSHPAYLRIIAMGEKVLPFILRELQERGGHWFMALKYIVDEEDNPVPPEHNGKMKLMREDWLEWGRRNRYL